MRIACALVLLLLVCSCGYIGDPLPPALNIPTRVTDLTVVERGDKILLAFTVPGVTTENLPIRQLGPVEAQIGTSVVELGPARPGVSSGQLPVREWIGQQVGVKVRLNNGRGRYSEWSNQVMIDVVEPLAPPSSVTAAPDPKGVRVSWQSPARPGQSWRIFREGTTEPAGVTDQPEFIDSGTEYGKEYKYRVQAVLGRAESEVSSDAIVIPKDVFPPAPPANLTVIQGIDSVELNWDPNTENDLKGYRVYRSTNGGATEVVAAAIEAPSYSDRKVSGNQTYRYSVTAIDQVGNESGHSQVVEIKTR